MSRARATRWSRCSRVMLAHGCRFRVGDARRQCRGGRRRRQARHRDRLGRRTARAHPAGRVARAGRKDRVRLARARRAAGANGARRICASASPTAASICCIPATSSVLAQARARLRPAGGRAQQRCLGASGSRARSVRSRASTPAPKCWPALEAVDLVVVFEQDTPLELIRQRAADRAGQGRRLQARAGGRPRDRRGARRRGDPGRSRSRLQHDAHCRKIARSQKALSMIWKDMFQKDLLQKDLLQAELSR